MAVETTNYEILQQESDPRLQAIGKEIQELIVNEKKGDEKDDKIDFDKIITENLDINQEDANKVISYIDSLLQQEKYKNNEDLKMLRTFFWPLAHPMEKYSMPQANNDIGVDEKVNVDKNLKAQIKDISNRIENILGNVPSDRADLIQTLNGLQTILKDRNDINTREMDQIKRLINFDNNSGDQSDAAVFQSLLNFIKNLEGQVQKLKDHTDMVNKYRESQSTFDSFYKRMITDKDYSNLDVFNNRENLNKIKFFIEHNPGNEKILDLYLTMRDIKDINGKLKGDGVRGGDRGAFNDVFNMLDNQYGEGKDYQEKVQQRFLDNHFKEWLANKSLVDFCKDTLKISWTGKNMLEGDTQIINFCKTRGGKFTEDQFIRTFNKLNGERRNNNVEALKGLNIINLLKKLKGDDILNKIGGRGDIGSLTIQLDSENNPVKLDEKTLLDLIGNYPFNNSDLPAGKGSFISDSEIFDTVQLRSSEIAPSWLKQIADRPLEAQPSGDNEDEGNHEGEGTLDALKLEEGDIKVYPFSGLKPKDIVAAVSNATSNLEQYTEQSDKTKFTQRIKDVVAAVKEGGDNPRTGSPTIKLLQENMNKVLSELNLKKPLVPDGKLGKNTLYVMQKYMGLSTDKIEDLKYNTNTNRLGSQLNKALNNYNDIGTLQSVLYDSSTNLQELQGKAEDYFDKPLKYVKDLLSLPDATFNVPGKSKINTIVTTEPINENKLKLLQMALLPKYEGKIDGKMGPLTTKALQTYLETSFSNTTDPLCVQSLADPSKSFSNITWSTETGFNTGNNIETNDYKDKFVATKENNGYRVNFFDETIITNCKAESLTIVATPTDCITGIINNEEYAYTKIDGKLYKKNNLTTELTTGVDNIKNYFNKVNTSRPS